MSSYTFKHSNERGAISGLMVAVIGLSVLVLGLGSFAIWAFVGYTDAQDNVDGKIAIAVAEAKQEQVELDEEKFAERIKQPNETFKGPADYCTLKFQYPKTWSVYESEEITNGSDFKAYLHPKVILPISSDQQYALRVTIEQKDFDKVVQQYSGLVSKGDLRLSTDSSNGLQSTRLDGNFSKNIRGSAVIYQCRDKTITVQTDADTFKSDFEAIVKTIDYIE